MQLQATININESDLPILHPQDQEIVILDVNDSTLVENIVYNPEKRSLDVWFTTGSAYTYFGVPLIVVFRFVAAKSKGEYFNRNIRGKYITSRIV